MQIVNSIYEKIRDETVLCVGNFDGLHLAHKKLILEVVCEAKKKHCKSMVITFMQHPIKELSPQRAPKILMRNSDKISELKSLGVDYIVLLDFREVKCLSSDEFLKYLSENYNMRKFICGFNFKFGYKNSGNVQYLKYNMAKYNYEVKVIDSFMIDDKNISSTIIRDFLESGNIKKVNEFLGRPFHIVGDVVKGKQLGRVLGFPTANILFDEKFCFPSLGVYATMTEYRGKLYKSMTNIGYNPTFDNEYISIETNIFDFSRDIYGESIKVIFLEKLRNEIKFESIENLIKQLNIDKMNSYFITKNYCNN